MSGTTRSRFGPDEGLLPARSDEAVELLGGTVLEMPTDGRAWQIYGEFLDDLAKVWVAARSNGTQIRDTAQVKWNGGYWYGIERGAVLATSAVLKPHTVSHLIVPALTTTLLDAARDLREPDGTTPNESVLDAWREQVSGLEPPLPVELLPAVDQVPVPSRLVELLHALAARCPNEAAQLYRVATTAELDGFHVGHDYGFVAGVRHVTNLMAVRWPTARIGGLAPATWAKQVVAPALQRMAARQDHYLPPGSPQDLAPTAPPVAQLSFATAADPHAPATDRPTVDESAAVPTPEHRRPR